MEFWEGAILVVGGVWLVAHMAKRQNQATQTVIGTATQGSLGTSNQSNLTTITNTAGGTPTIYGEPLEPANPPLMGMPINRWPVQIIARQPIAQPLYQPVSSQAPRTGIVTTPLAGSQIRRPMSVML